MSSLLRMDVLEVMLTYTAQFILFLLAVAGAVVALRALPRCRVHGRRIRWWLISLGAAAWIAAPITISVIGNEIHWEDSGSIMEVAWSAAATGLLSLAAALTWLAFRFDPSRGRLRCPRCWYDLSATPSRTCPECGCAPRHEKRLFRTRRSAWPVIAAALVTAISYAALKLPRVEVYGWGIFIPSTLIITAFGEVPASWIEDEDASTWDLWTRQGSDLWPWQEHLLQWRATRIIERSSDFERMGLADSFLDSGTPARMTEASTLEYVRRSIGNDDLPDLEQYLPPIPSTAAQSEIKDLVVSAMAHGDERAARNAAVFASLAPLHDAEIAAAIAARWKRGEPRFPSTGSFALALLANRNEEAWALYQSLLGNQSSDRRRDSTRHMVLIKARREAVIPLAERALEAPHDEVCRAGVSVLRNLSPEFLAYRDRLIAIARTRPRIGGPIAWNLAMHECDHPNFLGLLRERLASDDADQLRYTLSAIETLESRARPLRADLTARRATLKDAALIEALDAAVKSLDADPTP